MLSQIRANKGRVDKYSRQISSGIRNSKPAESPLPSRVVDLQGTLDRTEGHVTRIENARSSLAFQENVLQNAENILIRAKEIATQMANEVHSADSRASSAREVWGLRNQMVSLANSKFQGRFVFGGIDDDDPPFDGETTTYTDFGTTDSQQRYLFDNYDAPPTLASPPNRQTQITDNLSIRTSTAGDQVFSDVIASLEKLGRGLEGYRTDIAGTDFAEFTQPDEYSLQTDVIRETIDELETARSNNLQPERSSLGERQRQLDSARSILDLVRNSSQTYLSELQDTDITEAATNLSLAQTALEASYNVTNRLLNISILDFL